MNQEEIKLLNHEEIKLMEVLLDTKISFSIRGNSWYSNNYCRSAFRQHWPPGNCSSNMSFRILKLCPKPINL